MLGISDSIFSHQYFAHFLGIAMQWVFREPLVLLSRLPKSLPNTSQNVWKNASLSRPRFASHSYLHPSSRWCHPAISSSGVPFSSCPQSLPASVFSNESTLCMRWQKYWSFNFSLSPSNEHPGLISFRMDWLDLLAVQGTLKSLLQHHSSKASILQCSAFFIVQLSHPYLTTGKTIALTRRTFVGKVMSLLLNMLSRLVIVFLPRSKRLLISWLPSPSAVYNSTKRWCMCIGIADPLGPTIETNTTL